MSAPGRPPPRPPLTRTERLAAIYAAKPSPPRTDSTLRSAAPAAPAGMPGIDFPYSVPGTLAIDKPLAQPRYVACSKKTTFLP